MRSRGMKNTFYAIFILPLLFLGMPLRSQELDHQFVLGAGVHSGQQKMTLERARPIMEWAGITSVRQEVYWHRLEISKGQLKFPENLAEVENFIAYTKSKGGEPLLILDYGNKFYDNGDGVSSPEAIEAFAKYAEFVAKYFKGRVRLYEVWNEWNIGMGSNRKPRTVHGVDTYVSLLKATYKAVKSVDSNNIVLGGSVAGVDTKWTDLFIKAGGLVHLDAFSVHPYVIWNVTSKPEHAIRWVDGVHQKILENQPKRTIPIYITEIGWPNHDGKFSWGEEQTADFLIRLHILARSRPHIRGIWWYELVNAGRGKEDKEKAFGLVDADLKAKPALRAYRLVSYIFKNAAEIKVNESAGVSGRTTWEAKMKDGSFCRGHWLTLNGVGLSKATPYRSKMNTLWGDAHIVSETPYVGCERINEN